MHSCCCIISWYESISFLLLHLVVILQVSLYESSDLTVLLKEMISSFTWNSLIHKSIFLFYSKSIQESPDKEPLPTFFLSEISLYKIPVTRSATLLARLLSQIDLQIINSYTQLFSIEKHLCNSTLCVSTWK